MKKTEDRDYSKLPEWEYSIIGLEVLFTQIRDNYVRLSPNKSAAILHMHRILCKDPEVTDILFNAYRYCLIHDHENSN